jgi:hypothetical protein
MKKAVGKTKNKDAVGVKFMIQYKYLGLNHQNAGRLTAHIDSLKIKLKKLQKRFSFFDKKFLSFMIFKKVF